MGRKELPGGGEEDGEGSNPYRVGNVGWGLVPAQPPPKELVRGEYPIGDMRIVDAHDLEGEVGDGQLAEKAQEFEKLNMSVIDRAKEMGEDVVAYVGNNKKGVVLVGSGLAALFALTGFIIHNHRKRRREQESSQAE